MRRILHTLLLLAIAATAAAQPLANETLRKAARAFDAEEWASATALYNFALVDNPDDAQIYGYAIVSTDLMGDSARVIRLLDQAMTYAIPLDSLLTSVRQAAYHADNPDIYERFMLRAAQELPWMSRPIDASLLRYYAFRRNGPMMVAYAQKMLQASPKDIRFLSTLAEGHMIDGQPVQAVAVWQRILAIQPDNIDALLNLGNYYRLSGDASTGRPYLQRAYDLRPTPYLAYLLAL